MRWENNNRLVTMHTSDHFIIRLHSLLLPAREVQGHLLKMRMTKIQNRVLAISRVKRQRYVWTYWALLCLEKGP